MDQAEDVGRGVPAEDPFPTTHSTLREPGQRATLDDSRLHNRRVGSSLEAQEIAGQALSALARDGRLDLGDGLNGRITVKSEGRVATITGVVNCAGERMAVEELVEQIPGVEFVQEALTVSVDRYLDDHDLSEQVREHLDRAGLGWVGLHVSKGVVRLLGTATRLADVERAVKVAAAVKGIRDVNSAIKVRKPEGVDDLDLLSMAQQTLVANDLLVVDRELQVDGGVVHLAGKVATLADRRRVRQLIGEIDGVRAIKDHLQVDQTPFRKLQTRGQNTTRR